MTEGPMELQVAMSYLQDIDKDIERIKAEPNVFDRETLAKEPQKDIALANRELDKLAAQGWDVTKARSNVFFQEGRLAYAIAVNELATGSQRNKAAQCFEKSIQLSPSPEAYYNLGLTYALLNRKSSAIEAFSKVEQFGDTRLIIEAKKEIGRLDPKGRIEAATLANAGQVRSVAVGGHQINVAKKPHWGFIIGGIVALLFSTSYSIMLLIGLGLIGWGIFKGKPD
jgi:tetratricopeptide (TPR) repeat protein